MGNNKLVSVHIRDIDIDSYNVLFDNIDRRIFNKIRKDWEKRNLEDYFRALIYKLSKLKKEEVNKLVESDSKVRIE